jgi:hypothetical protein
MRRSYGGDNFTMLVGHKDGPSDPSRNGGGAPALIRNTISLATIRTQGGKFQNGAMVDASPLAPPVAGSSGTFTVNDNDFTTGPAVLVLGSYKLTSYVDYTPGGGVAATATAIAAAISRLTGMSATANVAVVAVVWEGGPNDEVEFRAQHYGSKTNFNTFTPNILPGFMGSGFPVVGAPVLAL